LVHQKPQFAFANGGFLHDFQLVDVNDFNGEGETTPTPHFYQNLGEAEFIVAIYMYMRCLGYPAEKISILTTYNGQKALLRDIVKKRCANNPLYGNPARITTVDKYQGQQNDYVLLSLVRTKSVGHLRDVRRLIVAMSRARLGLYIFCRKSLFENCYELTPTFSKLGKRASRLQLVTGETYETQRKLDQTEGLNVVEIFDAVQMSQTVAVLHQQRAIAYEIELRRMEEQRKLESQQQQIQMEEERIRRKQERKKAKKQLAENESEEEEEEEKETKQQNGEQNNKIVED